ncbi:hypothetical protein COB11_07985, partial [Candidatus Aerophobetes bacterium]
MALLTTAAVARSQNKLSQKYGAQDFADRTYSGAYRYATRIGTFACMPFAWAATRITGNQWWSNANLPALEVPPLLASARRVAERAKLELNDTDFAKFQHDFRVYLEKGAYTDQAKLHFMATTFNSGWIDKFWETMYCYGRECPIEKASWIGYDGTNPVNLNKFMGKDKLLVRGACMFRLVMDYKRELEAGTLDENMVFGFRSKKVSLPIDAEKCRKIFGTYRKPGVDCDTFVDHPDSTHAVVMHRGSTYILNLMKDGRVKTTTELYADLHSIYDDKADGEECDVNVLSSQKRADWATDREETIKVSDKNAAHM